MSCGFCHVGPSPVKPPADPENPSWANLSSNPGAQYFWVDRVFIWNPQAAPSNFIFQLFHTSLPGSLDTSFVSTDNINNPRTMNAVYGLAARLKAAEQWKETLAGGGLDNKQFDDYPQTREATKSFNPSGLFKKPDTVSTPRVLKDGSDSVGALGALNRVYLNIGLFSEEWLLHFRPLIGGKRITPIKISDANKNSAYWQATENMTPDMALFFLQVAGQTSSPTRHTARRTPLNQALLDRGKIVFAENCARCHSSSSRPISACSAHPARTARSSRTRAPISTGCAMKCRSRISRTTITCRPTAASRFRKLASTPVRRWRPMRSATTSGTISPRKTYKELPATGKITVYNPIDGTPLAVRDAGRRARLCAAGLADQRLVVGALSAE